MTYTRFETIRITCDECGESEQESCSEDEGNPIESEEDFLSDLKKEGWIYDEENDTHYCPDCIADIRADIDNYPEYAHLRK